MFYFQRKINDIFNTSGLDEEKYLRASENWFVFSFKFVLNSSSLSLFVSWIKFSLFVKMLVQICAKSMS